MSSPSPSALASELRRITGEEALALVDEKLGPSSEWRSGLVASRLSSDFQEHWKEEVGHWLKTAETHGFLEPLLHRVLTQAKRGTRSVGIDPNDRRHLDLVSELAPAMAVHYFVGTGWRFEGWEPIRGGPVDVDASLIAPSGTRVFFQVKAPDQPGRVERYRIVDGEYDARVIKAVEKAAGQLPLSGPEARFILVSAQRNGSLAAGPRCVLTHVFGSTVGEYGIITLRRSLVGAFWRPEWAHVTGVVLLDYRAGGDWFAYPCTVLLNPNADVKADPEWFPRARVLLLADGVFRWVRGAPDGDHTMPDGTAFVEGA